MTPANFFGKLKAGAYYNWRTYRVLPSVCAAQAAIESGWGESGLTKSANNLFGMKGSYNGSSVTMRTAEYTAGGSLYYINAAFRKYPNWNASVVDYANNLRKSGYYPASAFTTQSYRTQITLIGRVYATSPSYATDVIKMIETYGLDKWDKDAIAGGTGGTFDPSELGASDGGSGSGGGQYKTFQEDYIKENSTTRPKLKLSSIKGIVIHEIQTNATAAAFRNTLNSGYQGKKMGFHVVVDKSSAIAMVPLNEGVYHADRTGQKLVAGLSNPDNATISIGVINTNADEIPTSTLKNLTLVAAEIARIYNLPTKNIWPAYLVDGVIEPQAWYYNAISYSSFLAVAEAVKVGGEGAITNPDYGTPTGGGHDGKVNPQWGTYQYLVDIANATIRKFPGMRITSGYRAEDPYRHGSRQAIDIAFPASQNGAAKYKEVANWVYETYPTQVAYVITLGQVRDRKGSSGTGASGNWVRWPDNDHYDHLHIDGLLGANDISKAGSNIGGLIPAGEGAIQELIKEGVSWEGKLKYSMERRHQIYPGGYADCSSFTQYVVRKVTKRDIGSNTWAQVASGKSVPISQMRAGDLVFWEKTYNAPPPTHVGIVISGQGPTAKVVHCGPLSGVAVITANQIPGLYAARRIFSDADYNASQNNKNASKPTVSTKGTYALAITGATNAYSQDIGGYSVKRLPTGEVYRVAKVGVNSLKIIGKVGVAMQNARSVSAQAISDATPFSVSSAQSSLVADLVDEGVEMWVPMHSTSIQIAELPTVDAPIGTARIKIPVKVLDGPSAMSKQIYEGGKNKTYAVDEVVPIYAIENRFGLVSPTKEEWITLASAYVEVSVELETLVTTEVDFTKGQTIETQVIGRAIVSDEPFQVEGVIMKSGAVAFAHHDLLPIGALIKIEIPTNPDLNREVVVVSNNLETSNGNNIEIYFDNELDKYNFGTRNTLVSLVRQVEIPDELDRFFNGDELSPGANVGGGIIFE